MLNLKAFLIKATFIFMVFVNGIIYSIYPSGPYANLKKEISQNYQYSLNLPMKQLTDIFTNIIMSIPFNDSYTKQIEYVFQFVYSNISHNIDDEFYLYNDSKEKLLNRLLEHAFLGAPLPHSGCGPCAELLQILLKTINIESRIIFCFNIYGEELLGHTLLEVFNPESNSWEVYDPDKGFYFLKKGTVNKLSFKDLLFLQENEVTPANYYYNTNWQELKTIYKEIYFNYFSIIGLWKEKKIYINSNKVNLSHKYNAYRGKCNESFTLLEFLKLTYPTSEIVIY